MRRARPDVTRKAVLIAYDLRRKPIFALLEDVEPLLAATEGQP